MNDAERMTSSTLDTATGSRSRRVRLAWQVGRAALALLWLGWAVLTWWSTPRPTEIQAVFTDLDASRVVSYYRAEVMGRPDGFWGQSRPPRQDPDGVFLVWRTTDGQVHYAAPDLPVPVSGLRSAGGTGVRPNSRVEAAVRELDEHGVPLGADNPLARAARPLAGGLALIGVIMLIVGPAPIRGTRPFWFWIGNIPFGLGALAWLALERPWTYQDPSVPARRLHGWWGVGFLIVIGFGLNVILTLLRLVVPASILP